MVYISGMNNKGKLESLTSEMEEGFNMLEGLVDSVTVTSTFGVMDNGDGTNSSIGMAGVTSGGHWFRISRAIFDGDKTVDSGDEVMGLLYTDLVHNMALSHSGEYIMHQVNGNRETREFISWSRMIEILIGK